MFNLRKSLILSLLKFSGRNIGKNLKQIEKLAASSKKDIDNYQNKKLKDLLSYAHRNIPYYSMVLNESNVFKGEKVSLEYFYKIPLLTKKIIRKEKNNLLSTDKTKGVYENTSGGSTGEPVRFIQDSNYQDWNIATKLYIKQAFGHQDIGDRELRLWGSDADIIEGQEKLIIRIRNWLYNRREINTFYMLPEDKVRFVNTMKVFKPKWIEAYVQSAHELARYLINNNVKIDGVRGVLTTAGTLYPEIRKTIESAFHCRVYNRYGSREVGDMGCSCEKNDALHLFPWNNFIEIIGDEGNAVAPGEQGRVVVTNLNNYSMPIIRYDIGDIAVAHDETLCPCGRIMPCIEKMKGREIGLFKTKLDGLVDGQFFIHLFYHKQWVKKFQVIQKKVNVIQINYILASRSLTNKLDICEINSAIKLVMGADCEIEWKQVNRIDPLPSGKFIYTLSEVN